MYYENYGNSEYPNSGFRNSRAIQTAQAKLDNVHAEQKAEFLLRELKRLWTDFDMEGEEAMAMIDIATRYVRCGANISRETQQRVDGAREQFSNGLREERKGLRRLEKRERDLRIAELDDILEQFFEVGHDFPSNASQILEQLRTLESAYQQQGYSQPEA
ncbi:MAG: hypothetical protein V1659_03985 [Candidatus Woesearchaeota archaeon]